MLRISLVLLLLFALIFACSPEKRNTMISKASTKKTKTLSALPTEVIHPKNNLYSVDKEQLGKLLFFDPILSGNKDVACATCHHPNSGYAETLDLSIGVDGIGKGSKRTFKKGSLIPRLTKNAHTIINTAYNGYTEETHSKGYDPLSAPMFWDLRANSLEEQALIPIKTYEEMRGPHYEEEEILDVIVTRLQNNNTYIDLFNKAFPEAKKTISEENISKALATFEREITGNISRFDQYYRGDKGALSYTELDGMKRFVKIGCINCHSGPMLSDYKSHILSVPPNVLAGEESIDVLDHSFRTPTLRNLRFTFPYMHNGSLKSIRDILEFYEDISSKRSKNPNVPLEQIDSLARALTITVKDFGPLEAFLLSLNDEHIDKRIPESVPSGLPVGGNINP